MDKDKALNYAMGRSGNKRLGVDLGGKFSGHKSKRTASRIERERILSDHKLVDEKISQLKEQYKPIPTWLKDATPSSITEDRAMDKPKKLETQTDGDLSEVKKDPEETKKAWEVWLEKKTSGVYTARYSKVYPHQQNSKDRKDAIWREALTRDGVSFNDVKEEWDDEKVEAGVSDANKTYVTKPIPDSKGGRGSFQHCINANKDKKNPGGWCKQIERKIGGGKKKGLGALGEGKINRKTGKKMKLKPRKITLDEFESEKKIDEKARKKRESKEAAGAKKKRGKKEDMEQAAIRAMSQVRELMTQHAGYTEGPKGTLYNKPPSKQQLKEVKIKKPTQEEINEETKEFPMYKADYFVEEIRANIIYHNKIFPLVGMIAGSVARGITPKAAKVGGEILDDMGDMAKEEQEQ
jgi:hypothetical protein